MNKALKDYDFILVTYCCNVALGVIPPDKKFEEALERIKQDVQENAVFKALLNRYHIKDSEELEHIIINEGANEQSDKEYYEYVIKPLEEKAKGFDLVKSAILATPNIPVLNTPIGAYHLVTLAFNDKDLASFEEVIKNGR